MAALVHPPLSTSSEHKFSVTVLAENCHAALVAKYGTSGADLICINMADSLEVMAEIDRAHTNVLDGCMPFIDPSRVLAGMYPYDRHAASDDLLPKELLDFKRRHPNRAHGSVTWDRDPASADVTACVQSLLYPEFSLALTISRTEYERARAGGSGGAAVFVGGSDERTAARSGRCTGRVCSDRIFYDAVTSRRTDYIMPATADTRKRKRGTRTEGNGRLGPHVYARLTGSTVHVASLAIPAFWLSFELPELPSDSS